MTNLNILLFGLLLILTSACRKGSSKDGVKLTRIPDSISGGPTPPALSAEVNGRLTAGNMVWTLPTFLQGQIKNLNERYSTAAFNIDIVNAGEKKNSHITSDFEVHWCYPDLEVEHFIKQISAPPAENLASEYRADINEIATWTSETENFKGRLFLAKRYKSEGHTIYRLDVLIANEMLGECVHWKFAFMPNYSTDVKFIEGTDEYKALIESIATTWGDLGATF
jgi:hypothetical protein